MHPFARWDKYLPYIAQQKKPLVEICLDKFKRFRLLGNSFDFRSFVKVLRILQYIVCHQTFCSSSDTDTIFIFREDYGTNEIRTTTTSKFVINSEEEDQATFLLYSQVQ